MDRMRVSALAGRRCQAHLEQIDGEQLVRAVNGPALLPGEITEGQSDAVGLHRPPRPACPVAVAEVELTVHDETPVGLDHRARIDEADDVVGVRAVVPVQRHAAASALPRLDAVRERALDDPVAIAVDVAEHRRDGGELTEIRDLRDRGLDG
jgi:hypothetical protein